MPTEGSGRRHGRTRLPREGPLAIVYTDVAGSTAMNEALGDAAARRLLRAHDAIVRRETRQHGGAVLQPLGDGFKLAFPTASDAVRCAVAVQTALARLAGEGEAPPLSVRIGINAGEPIRERGDLFGEAVIVAQRVMSRAVGGRIFATESARASAGGVPGVRWVDRGLYHVKGFQRGFHVYEAVWSGDEMGAVPAPHSSDEPLWRGTVFVGRQRELRQLERCLDEAEEGRPRVVLLSGEPGIGKSRLAAEFLGLVTRRPVALASGRCFADPVEPFHPFLECLRQLRAALPAAPVPAALASDLAPLARLAPSLREWIPEEAADEPPSASPDERLRLLGACAGLLLAWAREHTLVLALDDLQWADEHSLDLLRSLARRLVPGLYTERARLLVVATARDGDEGNGALARVLADLERAHLLLRMPVKGLAREDVERMLRDLCAVKPESRLTQFVRARSQGNPYYVEEIFRDLRERTQRGPAEPGWTSAVLAEGGGVPRGVEALLQQRLRRLDGSSLEALRAAALVGPRFSVRLLCGATGSDEPHVAAALEEAERAGVAHPVPDPHEETYGFAHSLVAEVLAGQLTSGRRRRIHRAIARTLEAEADGGSEERLDQLCRHWMAAGVLAPPGRTAVLASAAARRALEVHALAEADRFADAALADLERVKDVDPLERAHLQALRVTTLGRRGRLDEAQRLAEAAIAAFLAQGRKADANAVRAALASALVLHARHRDALPYLEKAVGDRALPPSASEGWLLAEYAKTLDLLGRSDAMRATADRLVDLARRLRDPRLRQEALLVERNWFANHTSDVRRARALTRRALDAALARRDRYEQTVLWENTGLFDLTVGRLDDALDALDRALDLARETGALAKVVDVRALRALCATYRGEWQRVDDEFGEAMAVARQVPGSLRLGQLLWARTRVDLWLGRPVPPTPSAERTYPGIAEFATAILATLGVVASERGDPRAEEWLCAAESRHPADGCGLNWLPAAQAILAGWTNLERPRQAAPWYASLAPYRSVLNLHFTAYDLGRAATLLGRYDDAARDLGFALRVARREEMRPFVALTLRERARLWRMRGDRRSAARAERAGDEAARMLQRLGMQAREP